LRSDPNTPLGHYHLAFAYASLGRNQEAIADTRRNSRTRRKIPRFSTNSDTACWKPESWRKRSPPEKSDGLDPANSASAYDLGKALLLAGNAEAAATALRHSIELKPSDPSPHYQLARTLEKMGKAIKPARNGNASPS